MSGRRRPSAAGIVAIILAVGVGIGLDVMTFAVLLTSWDRFGAEAEVGISENATQLLTAVFSGVIGALSAYMGFTFGKKSNGKETDDA